QNRRTEERRLGEMGSVAPVQRRVGIENLEATHQQKSQGKEVHPVHQPHGQSVLVDTAPSILPGSSLPLSKKDTQTGSVNRQTVKSLLSSQGNIPMFQKMTPRRNGESSRSGFQDGNDQV